MKKFTTLLIILFSSTAALAQEDDTGAVDGHEQDRAELLELMAVAEKAMGEDISLMKEHVTDDFSIVTFSSRQFDDFDVFVTEWNKSREFYLQGGTFKAELKPEPAIFNGDIAICRGDSHNVMTTGAGKSYEFASPWTATCRKVDGRWKLVRGHSSIDPFNNPIVKSNVVGYLWKIGAGGLLGGIVIGLLAGMLLRKKK